MPDYRRTDAYMVLLSRRIKQYSIFHSNAKRKIRNHLPHRSLCCIIVLVEKKISFFIRKAFLALLYSVGFDAKTRVRRGNISLYSPGIRLGNSRSCRKHLYQNHIKQFLNQFFHLPNVFTEVKIMSRK